MAQPFAVMMRPKWVALAILVLIALAMARLAAGGEPKHVTLRPGLLELRLKEVPAGADISWEARQPLTLPFRVYEHGTVLVTYATSGQLVLVSDVIDWEGRRRDKTTWVVTVSGDDPTPGPDPVNPLTGLALETYQRARELGQPEVSKKLSRNFAAVASQIAAGAITSQQDAIAALQRLNKGSIVDARWEGFGKFLHGRVLVSFTDMRAALEAIALGLERAGGST